VILTDGQRVRLARIGNGWTLQNVADKSGFSISYLSKVEHDERTAPEVVRFILELDIQTLWYEDLYAYTFIPDSILKPLNKALQLED